MERFVDGGSIDEQIRKYTQQMMTQYAEQASREQPAPAQPAPAQAMPVQPAPAQAMPAQPMPNPPAGSAPVDRPSGDGGAEQSYRRYTEENTQRGILRVQTLTARGNYPVPGVKITISKVFEDSEYIIASQTTDNAGKTEGILLPAPDRALSESPGNNKKPYGEYKITAKHPQFATIVSRNVPVFSGESSLQMLNMMPLAASPNGEAPIQYVTTEPSDL